jgi:predicted Zn-dependent protease
MITMRKLTSSSAFLVACLLLASVSASAQVRGEGRISGKVVDEQGQPVADVQVRANKIGETQPLQSKTNNKGDWSINGMASGQWSLEFVKEGFDTARTTFMLDETGRMPPINVKLAKLAPAVDPNAEIQAEIQRAAPMLQASKFSEARKVYEDLLAKYPTVYQMNRFIASTYIAEKNTPKAIEHLKLVLDKEPTSVEMRLIMGDLLIESGSHAEGVAMLQSIEMTQVKDAASFINGAITLINEKKPDDALGLLDKVGQQFPDRADVHYYRGRAYVVAQKLPEAKASLEKYVSVAPPDARELADAKKILEQLKDVK